MNKFRKWLFKFLTGYELIAYSELLDTTIEILDLAKKISNHNNEIIDITKAVHERSEILFKKIQEVNGNETLD